MSVRPFRIVVIDDHAAWREQVTAMVHKSGTWQVVGEAADGPEGCALVASLKPDLILLDIGLPTMNGIDAAARMLASDPAARILFLTSHADWDVIEAALLTGARGYLLKNSAGFELLPAMSAIAAGRRFLSAAVGGRPFDIPADRPAPHEHHAGFYASDAALLADYEEFVVNSLAAGKIVVGVLGAARRQQLLDRLAARGLDVSRVLVEERCVLLDVETVLQAMLIDDLPDDPLLWKIVVTLMMRAARAARTNAPALAAFGDCAQTLWHDGMPSAAILLEQLWNDVSKTLNVDLLCGYTLAGLEAEDGEMRELIGATHSDTRTR